MNHILFVTGIAGLVTSTIYAILAGLGAVRFAKRRRREQAGSFLPPLSLLKPLYGSEPELEARLESFFRQDYPQYEILFCARNDRDPGLKIARTVAARHPRVQARFLLSGEPRCANAKVWSLERMQEAAQHAIFVISDSDVSVTPDYLRAVATPFANHRVGLVTCLYRGVAGRSQADHGSLWSRLEAEGMSIEMPAGVLVAGIFEGMKFALGPTMAVRRECVQSCGGFNAMGLYHADDFVLGNMVAAKGSTVVLSTHVIDHHILNISFLESARHQVRWMRSTRFSRPKGHLGTVLTFGMPYAILSASMALVFHRPGLAALLFAWGWTTRFLLAATMSKLVVEESGLLRYALLYPVRDLMGFFYWVASYLSDDVQWRGNVYHLSGDGQMRNQTPEKKPEPVLTV
jgi:ceramide glucosyltransferase